MNKISADSRGKLAVGRDSIKRALRGANKRAARVNYCEVCGARHGRRRGSKYCSDACAAKAYRARKAALRIENQPIAFSCLWCGQTAWLGVLHQKYCCGSCRSMASQYKRAVTPAALSFVLRMSVRNAEIALKQTGLRSAVRTLNQLGWYYDECAKCWRCANESAAA